MKIELFPNYPDEVKDYVNEYNAGVEQKDINVVGTAINSLVQFVFSPDEINRQAAIHALDQVGNVQPGFLKSAAKTLVIRYKGSDEIKKALATVALDAIFIEKKAEKLIEDQEVLDELKAKRNEVVQQQEEIQIREAKIVEEVQRTGLDLSVIAAFPELKTIGQYYNNSVLNQNEEQGLKAVQSLITSLVNWHKSDRSKFIPGCLLLSQILSPQNRQPFIQPAIDDLVKIYFKGNKDTKPAAEEIFESVFKEIIDLVPQDLAGVLQATIGKKQQEQQAKKNLSAEKAVMLGKLKIPSQVAWDQNVQKMAEDYNTALANNNEKGIKATILTLEKLLASNDSHIIKNATEVLGILINRNPEIIKNTVKNLVPRYEDPKVSIILGTIIEDLERMKYADEGVIQELRSAKTTRDAETEAKRQEKQAEYDRLEKITIKIDGEWPEKNTKFVEQLNQFLLKQDEKNSVKIINTDLKKFVYAVDPEIRKSGQIIFTRITEKYPNLLSKLMEDLVPLYLSEVEQRTIAVDLFGMLFDAGLSDSFFKGRYDEVLQNLNNDWANRKQDLENAALMAKGNAIKLDVTQIRIVDSWKSNIQKLVRDYNNAIKLQEMTKVMDVVRKIVDIFMKERNEEQIDQSNQVLGLIAKQNIELISPTIELFLQLLEGKDADKKTRAIKGLGEVTRQRPGWSYSGIEKLVTMSQNDTEEDFRMKASVEINRIAEKEASMLIEYLPNIVACLVKDPNRQVRRIAASTLGNMATIIATLTAEEQQKAIQSLTDALHDEYMLVRKFADNALTAIREAMRKAESK